MEDNIIKERIESVLPILNEKQIRLYLAAESKSYGWGGKSKIAKLAKVSRMLISRGAKEQANTDLPTEKNRILFVCFCAFRAPTCLCDYCSSSHLQFEFDFSSLQL